MLIILLLIIFCIILYKFFNNKPLHQELFLSTDKYTIFKLLENNAKIIESEIPIFDIKDVVLKRNKAAWNNEEMEKLFKKLEKNDKWIRSWDENDVWFNYPLIYNNKVVGLAEKICPNTIKLLKKIPIIRVCGFSLLISNSQLNIHKDCTGPTYNSMALNLLLKGNNCSLIIKPDNHDIYYENKLIKYKAVIFNSEQLHYAINYENNNRIILYIDFTT